MTDPDRLTILQRNGYTEREARFLCLVGDVGGYFLRRHFRQFLGTKRGRPEAALTAKLVEKRHAKRYFGPGGIELYHLSRRWFYRAIGSPECRNRRKRKPSAIHTRLLTLDFVLADSDRCHLFSDGDKTRYLAQERSVPRFILPVIQRRWIDRFPIYLDREAASTQPVVRFCYVDPQVCSEQRFRSFLERHTPLWERLGDFRVTYLTDRRWNGRAAKATFERFIDTRWPRSVRDQPSTRERILKAFRLEKRLRTHQIGDPQEHADWLIQELKQQLTVARYESLYGVWAQTSDQAVYDLVAPDPHELWPNGDLDVHLVGYNYGWLDPA